MLSKNSVCEQLNPRQKHLGEAWQSQAAYFVVAGKQSTGMERKEQRGRYSTQDHASVAQPDTPRCVLFIPGQLPN